MLSEYLVILNPAAARGRVARGWARAQAAFDAAGARYEVVRTPGPGEAAEIAERAVREGWAAVVAAGGDGTVHEVVNGLVRASGDRPTVPLGIVPLGSGNDFAWLAGVPRAPAAAVRRLLAAAPRAVDVGRVRGRGLLPSPLGAEQLFTNGVGVGFDARVAIAARRVRRLRGMAIYAWALLGVLRTHRTPRIRVEIDGVEVADRPLTLVTICNGGRHGGGFRICPDARIDDGRLDVCIAEALSRAGLLRLVPEVMRGTHVGRREVEIRPALRVHLTSDDALAVHADGEILAEAAYELEIEILPGRLTLLA
jgi:YegS/Rv2252/BmrU family lipid kinase